MGITIHYQGSLGQIAELPKLVEELGDIAKAMRWDSHPIELDAENTELAGIILSPGGDCESLTFLFDRSGRMRNLADLITGDFEPDPRYSYHVCVKTQFAAVETHIWIIGLLRYLKKKYITDLKVTDEGDFWESEDLNNLTEKRRFLQSKIDLLADGLSGSKELPSDIKSLVTEIERIVRESPPRPSSNSPPSPEG